MQKMVGTGDLTAKQERYGAVQAQLSGSIFVLILIAVRGKQNWLQSYIIISPDPNLEFFRSGCRKWMLGKRLKSSISGKEPINMALRGLWVNVAFEHGMQGQCGQIPLRAWRACLLKLSKDQKDTL